MHTRCVIKCFRKSQKYGNYYTAKVEDFGIPYQEDHSVAHMHPLVIARVQDCQQKYDGIKVEFNDV